MVICTLKRILALRASVLSAEAVRVDPPASGRSRRSSRRIVKKAPSTSLADWFPANLAERSALHPFAQSRYHLAVASAGR